MRDILTAGLAEMGVTPPQGAVEALCRYAQLMLEQNQVMNLTAITELESVARLHFLDSAGVLAKGGVFAGGAGSGGPTETPAPAEHPSWLAGKSVIDVGTGAGFPGMVLKILEPSLSLTLLDSLGKRVRWLESAAGDLGLDGVRCLHARAEEQALVHGFRDSFDVVTSRAVASLPLLCELCLPYVKVGGLFLAMKSVESGAEVAESAAAVKKLGGRLLPAVDYAIPGTDVTHRLIAVKKAAPTQKGYPRKWGQIKKSHL